MEIKGTIKYVLIVLLLFHKYILYLSQIHPVSKISVTDVGGYSTFNIHSRMIPRVPPGLYSTQQGPLLVPLSSWGIWALSTDTDQDSCPGWLTLYHSILSASGRASLLVLLPLKHFPATSVLPISFLCAFCVVYGIEPLCETIH